MSKNKDIPGLDLKSDFQKRKENFEEEYVKLMEKYRINVIPILIFDDLLKDDKKD